MSRLNDRLASLGRWVAYGDSIYPVLSNLLSALRGERDLDFRDLHHFMKSARIAIEWSYGALSNLFSYLRNLDKLKVMASNRVLRVFFVATLLRNCHVALYGGIESNYFDLAIRDDMLELYLQQL